MGYNAEHELMQAGDLKIGNKLLNGVSASCYVYSTDFAAATHRVMAPFRFLSEYVSEYYTATMVEPTVFSTAHAINLGGHIGANLGLPAFVNVFIIILLLPLLFVKQFIVFCFSQYSVLEFGHSMRQYFIS